MNRSLIWIHVFILFSLIIRFIDPALMKYYVIGLSTVCVVELFRALVRKGKEILKHQDKL